MPIYAQAEGYCPDVVKSDNANTFPLDYNARQNNPHLFHLVEIAHFTPSVEELLQGNTSQKVGPDLDYTLNAYPNHPRALNALVGLAIKGKTNHPDGMKYTVECYFQRASQIAPDDPIPHLVHGNYLAKTGKDNEALAEYQAAEKLDPQNANLQYNMGLLYFNLKQYDQALSYAHKAYDNGFPLPGLKQKLESTGQWKDSPPQQNTAQ